MKRNILIASCTTAAVLLLSAPTGPAWADPLPPVDSGADSTQDFENRRSSPGVFFSNGFDSWGESHEGYQVRTGDYFVHEQDGPQSVPNNCALGRCYPAHDPTMAASGSGSLRLTANAVADANHSGGWYFGSKATNCSGGTPGTGDRANCRRWPESIGEGETVTMSYRVRQNSAMNDYPWRDTGGEALKFHIMFPDDSSCSDLQNVMIIGTDSRVLNLYSNCGQNPMRYGILGNLCSSCRNTFDYPPFGPAIFTGSSNSSYWTKQSPEGPPNGYQYASTYTDHSRYSAMQPDATDFANTWWWLYVEIDVGARRSIADCNEWSDPDCSHVRAWISFGNGDSLKQFKDFRWPWQINRSGTAFQNIMLTAYQTGKELATNSGDEHRWYDELILSTEPQHMPADLSLPSGATGPDGGTGDRDAGSDSGTPDDAGGGRDSSTGRDAGVDGGSRGDDVDSGCSAGSGSPHPGHGLLAILGFLALRRHRWTRP